MWSCWGQSDQGVILWREAKVLPLWGRAGSAEVFLRKSLKKVLRFLLLPIPVVSEQRGVPVPPSSSPCPSKAGWGPCPRCAPLAAAWPGEAVSPALGVQPHSLIHAPLFLTAGKQKPKSYLVPQNPPWIAHRALIPLPPVLVGACGLGGGPRHHFSAAVPITQKFIGQNLQNCPPALGFLCLYSTINWQRRKIFFFFCHVINAEVTF